MDRYYICKYDSHVDGIDLEGFSIFDEKEYEVYYNTIYFLDFYNVEIYFGDDRCKFFHNVEELSSELKWGEISKENYNTLKEKLGEDYGILTPRRILDELFELPRTKK